MGYGRQAQLKISSGIFWSSQHYHGMTSAICCCVISMISAVLVMFDYQHCCCMCLLLYPTGFCFLSALHSANDSDGVWTGLGKLSRQNTNVGIHTLQKHVKVD